MPATPRCSARSARRCWTAPARARRRGSRTAWAGRRASATRASCGRSRTTRSCSSSAGARTRCRAWRRGRAASRDVHRDCAQNSRRFHRALDLATHALAHSDIDVLRAVIATLDPGTWLDRAGAHPPAGPARGAGRGGARAGAAGYLGGGAVDVPPHPGRSSGAARRPGRTCRTWRRGEVLLHALRLALIHRIWLLATEIPDFSPRHGVTRQVLEAAILRLDIEPSLALLAEIFPAAPDPGAECDYAEPAPPRGTAAYAREHAEIFAPMRRCSRWCARSPPRSPTRSARSGRIVHDWHIPLPQPSPASRERAHLTPARRACSIVMAGLDGPSTSSLPERRGDVDGRPSPAMTMEMRPLRYLEY